MSGLISEQVSFLFLIRDIFFEHEYFEIYSVKLKSRRNWDFMTRAKEINVIFVGLKSGCNWDFMIRVKEILFFS